MQKGVGQLQAGAATDTVSTFLNFIGGFVPSSSTKFGDTSICDHSGAGGTICKHGCGAKIPESYDTMSVKNKGNKVCVSCPQQSA